MSSSRALIEALASQRGVQRGRLGLSCFSSPVAQRFLKAQWVNDSSFGRWCQTLTNWLGSNSLLDRKKQLQETG